MQRVVVALIASLMLAGCGIGETAVVAATGAASQVEQAKEARRIKERARRQLDAAASLDAQRRQDAEADTQENQQPAHKRRSDECSFSACAQPD